MNVLQRVECLERQNRGLRRWMGLFVVIAVLCVSTGANLVKVPATAQDGVAKDEDGVHRWIHRGDVLLVDDRQDVPRVLLSRNGYLRFYDVSGNEIASLTVSQIQNMASRGDVARVERRLDQRISAVVREVEQLKRFNVRNFSEIGNRLLVRRQIIPNAGFQQPNDDGIFIQDDNSSGRMILQNHGADSWIQSKNGGTYGNLRLKNGKNE